MTTNDPTSKDDPEHGILADGVSVETSGIDVLGTTTAHVVIPFAQDEDDDDDDVVDDERIDLDAPLLVSARVLDDARVDRAIEDAVAEDAVIEDSAIEDPTADSVEKDPAVDAVLADEPVEDHPLEDAVLADELVEDELVEDELGDDAVFEDEPVAQDPVVDETVVAAAVDEEPAEDPAPAVDAAPVDPAPAPAPVTARLRTGPVANRSLRQEPVKVEKAMTRHDVNLMASRTVGQVSTDAERETPDLLTADRLLEPRGVVRPEPEGAWRHFLYSVSGHRINLGDGRRARERKELDRSIAAALPGGARFVPVLSRKGGVGKTTVTTVLGMALADARDDRVMAVDANPDRGTLAERISRRSDKTVRDLVREKGDLRGYNDLSSIVARDETRLDVLASDTDPHVSHEFGADEYSSVAEVAAHYYSVVLTDTGTGIVHSVMEATLGIADQIVVVAGLSIDEARLASETLTWLEANGYETLVRNAIVVLNMASPGSSLVRRDEVENHFRTRVRDVVRMPHDPLIASGGSIVFRDLQPATRTAARQLAAKVVEGLRTPAPVL